MRMCGDYIQVVGYTKILPNVKFRDLEWDLWMNSWIFRGTLPGNNFLGQDLEGVIAMIM